MSFTTKKIEQKISPITLILKYICKISYFVTSIILSRVFYTFNFSGLLFKKKTLINLNLKLIKYTLLKKIQYMISIHYQKNLMSKYYICVNSFLGA